MLRQVQGAFTPYPGATVIAPTDKGGTSGSTPEDAVDNLGGVHRSKLGVPGGVLRADARGNIPEEILGDMTAFGYSVDGPLSLVHGEIADYFITNFSSHRPLIVSVTAGSVSIISEDVVRLVAPAEGMEVGLTIGSRTMYIPLSAAGPARPSLETISGETTTRIFYSTEFRGEPLGFGEWITPEAGVTPITIPDGTSAIEIRGQRGVSGVAKLTMNGIDFTCGLAATNRRVDLVTGAPVAVTVSGSGSLQYRMISMALVHVSTDWEIALDDAFNTIVKSSYNDTVNKLSWEVTLPGGDYYLRFRHKGSNG